MGSARAMQFYHPRQWGRGKCRLEKHALMPAHVSSDMGAIPCRLHRLQKHLRGVEEITRKVLLRGLGHARTHVEEQNLCRRLRTEAQEFTQKHHLWKSWSTLGSGSGGWLPQNRPR